MKANKWLPAKLFYNEKYQIFYRRRIDPMNLSQGIKVKTFLNQSVDNPIITQDSILAAWEAQHLLVGILVQNPISREKKKTNVKKQLSRRTDVAGSF